MYSLTSLDTLQIYSTSVYILGRNFLPNLHYPQVTSNLKVEGYCTDCARLNFTQGHRRVSLSHGFTDEIQEIID